MKKDLKGLGHERTILLAILLQLFIALFSSFLMVGLTSMYDPSALSKYSTVRYNIAYNGSDSDLRGLLASDASLRVYDMELAPALQSLKERKLVAVVYVPDTRPDATDPVKITLYTLKNDLQASCRRCKAEGTVREVPRESSGRSEQSGLTRSLFRLIYPKVPVGATTMNLSTGS